MTCKLYKNSEAIRDKLFNQKKQIYNLHSEKLRNPNQENVTNFNNFLLQLKKYKYCIGRWHIISTGWGTDSAYICPSFTGEKIIEKVEENNTQSYIEKTFENFKQSYNEVNEIKNFINSEKLKTLFIMGNTGTGKTHLAKATQLFYMLEQKHVEFIMAPELNKIFLQAESWNTDIKEKNEAKQRLLSFYHANILIIDDLGCKDETKTKFFGTNLLLLLEKRKKGKLIITTNINITTKENFDKISNKKNYLNHIYDNRIISRLIESHRIISLKNNKDLREQ